MGTDEFSDESEVDLFVYGFSEIFTARDVASREVKAFILIQNSAFTKTRDADSSSATILIFRDANLSSDDVVYGGLIDVAVEFTKIIDIGYMQCFVDVALCHYGLFRQLRQRGFYTAVIVPRGVHIAGLGLRENAIMCKDFGIPDRRVRAKNIAIIYSSIVL